MLTLSVLPFLLLTVPIIALRIFSIKNDSITLIDNDYQYQLHTSYILENCQHLIEVRLGLIF